VVDEHAGQLVADGTLHEGCGDRGVDPTGQAADDARVTDLLPHRRHEVIDDVGGRPLTRETGAPQQEVLEHLLAERRVQHLGVPLHPVEVTLVVLEARDGGS
jgi:hypothetical protein